MVPEKAGSYWRFIGPVVGAACLTGVLAAAGEYVLGAVAVRGSFWGQPRLFYQLLLGAEAAWLVLAAAVTFGVGGSLWYLLAGRRRRGRLAAPARLVLIGALLGIPVFRWLATLDIGIFYGRPKITVVAVFLGLVAAWFGGTWGLYALAGKVKARLGLRRKLSPVILRVLVLAVMLPFVVAEGWALWQARTPSPRKPDIFVVIMDAFRADRLKFYGGDRHLAPTLERFGDEAVVFRESFTVTSWTKPAVASVFTGAYPGAHGVNARFYGLPEGAVTLAQVLREEGYRTIGVSANPNVTRYAGMGAGFDILDSTGDGPIFNAAGPPLSCARPLRVFLWMRPYLGPLWKTTADGVEMNRRAEFYRRICGDRPTFVYMHYMETHTPNPRRPEYRDEIDPYWNKVDPARARFIANGPFFWFDVLDDPSFVPNFTEDELALAKALYDTEVRRMDVVIDDFLGTLAAPSGDDAGALVVITADHGEEFLEHGRWLHGVSLHHEVARVPLMIRMPECRPAVLAGPVNLVDVPRTVVSFAGAGAPEAWDGMDLGPYVREGRDVPRRELPLESIHDLLAGEDAGPESGVELSALVNEGYYYLHDENADREYLYDRQNDFWQKDNLAAAPSAETETLLTGRRDALAAQKRKIEEKAFAQGELKLPPELERQLRTLGYVR
jgi:arylsulfatase A-like enzyme